MAPLHVRTHGTGAPILLVHGWPHTGRLWDRVVPLLAHDHRVVVPDLRGTGDSPPAPVGYDAADAADDLARLLDDGPATVVAIDAGVTPATVLALSRPDLVSRLVVSEAMLPGLAPQPPHEPWWFGLHATPGLPERALAGNEATYVSWFLTEHVVRPIPPDVREAFVSAYEREGALGRSLVYYRSRERDAAILADLLATRRLTTPTVAVAGGVVGALLGAQLAQVADDLTEATVDDCGHLVPLEQPEAFARWVQG